MPEEQKAAIIKLIESLNVAKGGELYNKIVDHITEYGEEKPVEIRVHSSGPPSTCISCEG